MSALVAGLAPGVRHADLRRVRIALDVVSVASPWVVGCVVSGQVDATSCLVAVGSWMAAAVAADRYREHDQRPLAAAIGTLVTLALAGALAASFALGSSAAGWLPRVVPPLPLGLWGDLAMVAALLVGSQVVYTRSTSPVDSRRRLLILGSHASAQAAAHLLGQALSPDCVVIGCVADDTDELDAHSPSAAGAPTLGSVDQLVELVHAHHATQVVLASHGVAGDRLVQRIADARAQGTEVTTIFELYRAVRGRVPLEDAPAYRLAALTAHGDQELSSYALLKRLIDVTLGLCGLVLLALVVPFIALLNAIDSPGPLFYAQARIGRAGRTFIMFKFRSMFVDAEHAGEVEWCRDNDPRITRVGRLLRKSHLDETPQFWNIVLGDMSLVGPRPERPEFVQTLRAEIPCYSARHAVQPGLTGWAQVNYTYGNSPRDALIKLEYDLFYVQHRGLRLDFQCMLRTVPSVVLLRGT